LVVDAATLRTLLERNLDSGSDSVGAHDMYHEDAVLEFPQSDERFEGVESFREWRSSYPAETSFEFREIRGNDDVWVVELTVTYDGDTERFGVSIYELREDRIARETIYVAEGWEPPEWRAKWRAAP
jgi:hypothetical protein